jgi:hypothetical protein
MNLGTAATLKIKKIPHACADQQHSGDLARSATPLNLAMFLAPF